MEVLHFGTRRLLALVEGYNCTPAAYHEFPPDLLSDRSREVGGVLLHVCVVVYMFTALAIVCDDYFVPSLGHICEKMGFSEDVAGATFMAAGSSAPELFTSIIGVFVAKGDVGTGTIVGSAVFNILCIIGLCGILTAEVIQLNWWPLVRDSFFYALAVVALILVHLILGIRVMDKGGCQVIKDGYVTWWESVLMLILYSLYILVMKYNAQLRAWTTAKLATRLNLPEVVKSGYGVRAEILGESLGLLRTPRRRLNVWEVVLLYMTGRRFRGSTRIWAAAKLLAIERRRLIRSGRLSPVAASDAEGHREDFERRMKRSFSRQLTTEDPDLPAFDAWKTRPDYYTTPLRHWLLWHMVGPIKFVFSWTIPDSRKTAYERFYMASFALSVAWIALLSYIMVWMVTVVGYTFGIPDSIMGITFLAAGTSIPDAMASIIVAKQGQGDMAVSNSVGSNVFDILLGLAFPWFLQTAIVSPGTPARINSNGLVFSVLLLFLTVAALVSNSVGSNVFDILLGLAFPWFLQTAIVSPGTPARINSNGLVFSVLLLFLTVAALVSNSVGSNVFDILLGLAFPWFLQTAIVSPGTPARINSNGLVFSVLLLFLTVAALVSNSVGSNVFDILLGLAFPWFLQTAIVSPGTPARINSNGLVFSVLLLFLTVAALVSNSVGSNVFDILLGLAFPWFLQTAIVSPGTPARINSNGLVFSVLLLFLTVAALVSNSVGSNVFDILLGLAFPWFLQTAIVSPGTPARINSNGLVFSVLLLFLTVAALVSNSVGSNVFDILLGLAFPWFLQTAIVSPGTPARINSNGLVFSVLLLFLTVAALVSNSVGSNVFDILLGLAFPWFLQTAIVSPGTPARINSNGLVFSVLLLFLTVAALVSNSVGSNVFDILLGLAFPWFLQTAIVSPGTPARINSNGLVFSVLLLFLTVAALVSNSVGSNVFDILLGLAFPWFLQTAIVSPGTPARINSNGLVFSVLLLFLTVAALVSNSVGSNVFDILLGLAFPWFLQTAIVSPGTPARINSNGLVFSVLLLFLTVAALVSNSVGSNVFDILLGLAFPWFLQTAIVSPGTPARINSNGLVFSVLLLFLTVAALVSNSVGSNVFDILLGLAFPWFLQTAIVSPGTPARINSNGLVFSVLLLFLTVAALVSNSVGSNVFDILLGLAFPWFLQTAIVSPGTPARINSNGLVFSVLLLFLTVAALVSNSVGSNVFDILLGLAFPWFLQTAIVSPGTPARINSNGLVFSVLLLFLTVAALVSNSVGSNVFDILLGLAFPWFLQTAIVSPGTPARINSNGLVFSVLLLFLTVAALVSNSVGSNVFDILLGLAFPWFLQTAIVSPGTPARINSNGLVFSVLLLFLTVAALVSNSVGSNVFDILLGLAFPWFLQTAIVSPGTPARINSNGLVFSVLLLFLTVAALVSNSVGSNVFDILLGLAFPWFLQTAIVSPGTPARINSNGLVFSVLLLFLTVAALVSNSVGSNVFDILLGLAFPWFLQTAIVSPGTPARINSNGLVFSVLLLFLTVAALVSNSVGSNVFDILLGLAFPWFLQTAIVSPGTPARINSNGLVFSVLLLFLTVAALVSNSVGSNVFDILLGLAFPWFLQTAIVSPGTPARINSNGLVFSVLLLFLTVAALVSNSVGSNVFDILLGLAFPWFLQTAIVSPGTPARINSNGLVFSVLLLFLTVAALVSNSVGSNVFDILLGLAFPWFLQTAIVSPGTPARINSNGLVFSVLLLTVAALVGGVGLNGWRLDRRLGTGCLALYAVFITLSCMIESNVFGFVNPPNCPVL